MGVLHKELSNLPPPCQVGFLGLLFAWALQLSVSTTPQM
jgi:hypothetical protein